MSGKRRIVTDEGMAGESESVKRKAGRQAAWGHSPFCGGMQSYFITRGCLVPERVRYGPDISI